MRPIINKRTTYKVYRGDGTIYLPTIIRDGVAAMKSTIPPRVMNTILPLAIHSSLRCVLILEGAKLMMAGKMAANNAMLTPARRDNNNPACPLESKSALHVSKAF